MSELSKVYVRTMPPLNDVPNSDNLLFGEMNGLTFIVNRHDGVKPGETFILIPYDIIVPDREEFGFVRGQRIKPMRLRGVFSMAVCLPNVWNFPDGADVTEALGFVKWEPAECRDDGITLQNGINGREIAAPFFLPKYDIENLRAHHKEFVLGEYVYLSEKIHGENMAIAYFDDKMWVRSRSRWIEEGENKWWQTAHQYDWSFLKDHQNLVLFGEKYGNVKGYRYDCTNGSQKIAIFDVFDRHNNSFFPIDNFLAFTAQHGIITPPTLYRGPWQGIEQYRALAEENSTWGNHIREGYVARGDGLTGKFERRVWKWVSERYLLDNNKRK